MRTCEYLGGIGEDSGRMWKGAHLYNWRGEKVGGGTCHNDKPGQWGCQKD